MQIYSVFMFAGIFTTLLIPETKRKTLEELAGEYEMGAVDLIAEGIVAAPEGKDVKGTSSGHSV